MKKMILMALFCAATVSVSAQRVYKADVSGNVTNGYTATRSANGTSFIIECKGMPEASYTKTAKPTTQDELKTAETNKKVAYKFEVANEDLTSGGSGTWTDGKTNWENAYAVAIDKGEGWRLPTQRELMLIWLMKEALAKFNPLFNSLATGYYWSATEYNANFAWYVGFYNGNTNASGKTNSNRVRLVRDIK